MTAHQRTRRGLARSFQLPRPFASMTVADNLRVPLIYTVARARRRQHRLDPPSSTTAASSCSSWSRSTTRPRKMPRDLTQVEMRKLELARAMAAEPKLLIADEAMAGLSHSEVEDIVGAADPAQRARHHHHHDRAHHARGDELLAAAGRAGLRQEDRRRQAGGGDQQSARWWGPILANSITHRIEAIDAAYGAVRVLEDVSLDVDSGETVVLLGTNGNGKSTLMKCIMGMVRPSAGRIIAEIDGVTHDLVGLTTEADRRSRHRAGAGRPPPVPAPDRRGKSAARRVAADGAAADQAQSRILLRDASRGWPSARASSPAA